jgi:hypothetical protein
MDARRNVVHASMVDGGRLLLLLPLRLLLPPLLLLLLLREYPNSLELVLNKYLRY